MIVTHRPNLPPSRSQEVADHKRWAIVLGTMSVAATIFIFAYHHRIGTYTRKEAIIGATVIIGVTVPLFAWLASRPPKSKKCSLIERLLQTKEVDPTRVETAYELLQISDATLRQDRDHIVQQHEKIKRAILVKREELVQANLDVWIPLYDRMANNLDKALETALSHIEQG